MLAERTLGRGGNHAANFTVYMSRWANRAAWRIQATAGSRQPCSTALDRQDPSKSQHFAATTTLTELPPTQFNQLNQPAQPRE